MINACDIKNLDRRRSFWTTRMQACGSYVVCGNECALPGLEYEDHADGQRTIRNDDWLQSLILNILNTKARTDMKCPNPLAVFGHWSESYRDDGLTVGSTLWNAAAKPYRRTSDMVNAIRLAVTADMQKLITLEVADTVTVEAEYGGNATVKITIEAVSSVGRSKVNLSGAFVTETWVWR